jgi:ubiquinone/menaquinone biosynthesis C-methylase UbiE
MLAVAQRRAADLERDVDLRIGQAQALESPDESFKLELVPGRAGQVLA